MNTRASQKILPEYFKPLLWSYDFSKLDTRRDKRSIIINAINYGALNHWKWLVDFYGKKTVRGILKNSAPGEIRPHIQKLLSIIFKIKKFNNAPRGIRR